MNITATDRNIGIVPPWLTNPGAKNPGIVPPWLQNPVHILPVDMSTDTQFVRDETATLSPMTLADALRAQR